MQLPGGWELVLILIVVMVLFGAKRLPDSARSLGRSLRIFKAETKGLRDDDVRTRAEAPHVRQPIDAADEPAYRRAEDEAAYRRRADDTPSPSPAPVADPVERREQR